MTVDPEAEQELAEACAWYARQRPGLEDELLLCLDAAFAAISKHLLRYAQVIPRARRFLLDRFPYAIVYQLRARDVLVLAFHHTSRDPQRWKDRL